MSTTASPAQDDIVNPPGQRAIGYRVRAYGTSLSAMLAGLGRFTIPSGPNQGARPLAALTTRATDDPTIALLDVWAMVIDVLTFYQERIANEGYLGTATERLSVVELTRSIGYELKPGLAATAHLAFDVEDAPGSPGHATVSSGTQVQSLPGQNELPQTFETTETIEARAAWNELRPLLTSPQRFDTMGSNASSIVLEGAALGLSPGQLLWVSAQAKTVHVGRVTVDAAAGRTTIDLFSTEYVKLEAAPTEPSAAPQTPEKTLPLTPDNVATWILGYTWEAGNLDVFLRHMGWDAGAVSRLAAALSAEGTDPKPVFAFGQQVGFFGRLSGPAPDTSTPVWQQGALADVLLDRVVEGIVPGSRVVIEDPSEGAAAYKVSDAKDHAVTAKIKTTASTVSTASTTPTTTTTTIDATSDAAALTTRLTFDEGDKTLSFLRDTATAHVQSQALSLAPTLVTVSEIGGIEVHLDHMEIGLSPGRLVVVTGQRRDAVGVTAAEVMKLAQVTHGGGTTKLTFETALAYTYVADTVRINANVAPATHGQTVEREVLGSGDGSRENQSFVLSKTDLTHVPAPTASGGASTLSVRVNDVLWKEVSTLFGQDGQAQCYMVRADDAGRTSVIFGDGVSGARLPTGLENVVASYRTGLGPSGRVGAEKLIIPINRPLGIRGVENHLVASGGVAAETIEEAKVAAPLSVRTMGRVVTLADYQDFAASFPGVGKAQATRLTRDGSTTVHVTVTGRDGAPLDAAAIEALHDTIERLGDPTQDFRIDDGPVRFFEVKAALDVDPRLGAAAVRAAARQALGTTFGFAARRFGQPVHPAEIIAALQRVPGVRGVRLENPKETIDASLAHWVSNQDETVGAELVMISPIAVVLT